MKNVQFMETENFVQNLTLSVAEPWLKVTSLDFSVEFMRMLVHKLDGTSELTRCHKTFQSLISSNLHSGEGAGLRNLHFMGF